MNVKEIATIAGIAFLVGIGSAMVYDKFIKPKMA
jgi:hypothetical protein